MFNAMSAHHQEAERVRNRNAFSASSSTALQERDTRTRALARTIDYVAPTGTYSFLCRAALHLARKFAELHEARWQVLLSRSSAAETAVLHPADSNFSRA